MPKRDLKGQARQYTEGTVYAAGSYFVIHNRLALRSPPSSQMVESSGTLSSPSFLISFPYLFAVLQQERELSAFFLNLPE